MVYTDLWGREVPLIIEDSYLVKRERELFREELKKREEERARFIKGQEERRNFGIKQINEDYDRNYNEQMKAVYNYKPKPIQLKPPKPFIMFRDDD